MSPRPSSLVALAGLALLTAAAAPARADAVLDVSGEVLATQPRLEVRVVVTNRGDRAAAAIEVTGELLAQERTARLAGGLAPGRSGSVVLEFDPAGAVPGVHALPLLLEHALPGVPDAGGNPPLASQRAWLLVALGASPPPCVRLAAEPARVGVRGTLEVALASADGAPHRIRLRALPARGVRVETPPVERDVPATGSVRVPFVVVRSGAPRGTRHGVLLVAESVGEHAQSTAVAVAAVEVAPDESWLPRHRRAVLVVGLLLLGAALAAEVFRAHGALLRRFRPGRGSAPPAA